MGRYNIGHISVLAYTLQHQSFFFFFSIQCVSPFDPKKLRRPVFSLTLTIRACDNKINTVHWDDALLLLLLRQCSECDQASSDEADIAMETLPDGTKRSRRQVKGPIKFIPQEMSPEPKKHQVRGTVCIGTLEICDVISRYVFYSDNKNWFGEKKKSNQKSAWLEIIKSNSFLSHSLKSPKIVGCKHKFSCAVQEL